MAKLNRTLLTVKKSLESSGISPEKGKRTTKKVTRALLAMFSAVEDPREAKLVEYPLGYILLIAFLAVLGGANTWQEMHDFGVYKAHWLRKFMDIKKYGIPSHDTFRRVFGLIDKDALQSIVVTLLEENLSMIKKGLHIENAPDSYRLLCIDGKEENGTGRAFSKCRQGKVRNLQTLHVYDFTNGICLASKPIEEKTNEIPAAQELLSAMDLSATVCTFDALHMQRKTISIIRDKQGHYVGGLKGNQHGLMTEAASRFTEEALRKLKRTAGRKKPSYMKNEERAHSQKEVREFFLVKPEPDGDRDGKWKGLKSFVMCRKTLTPDNPALKESVETRYYASDLDDLELIADAIRSHWSVEQFHWQLDVSFREDDNSTMDVTAYNNLSTMIKLSLHLFQLMKLVEKRTSVNRLRKQFGWDFEGRMESLLSFFHDEAIINAIEIDKMSEAKLV